MRILRNVLLATASVFVGLVLAEIGVRALRVDYNLTPNWKYHPILGWSQVPSAKYDAEVQGRPLHVSFNAMGFRDDEHEAAKPPGVKRVVVIGDSFSEAVQVNLEQTFHQRLEELLNQRGPEKWEVINLGVGDFGTAQEYIALLRYGFDFHPDVVVHQIFPLNDVCNNNIELYGLCLSKNDRYRPYFVEKAGALEETYAQPMRTWLRRHSASYNAFEYWFLRATLSSAQTATDPLLFIRAPLHSFKSPFDPLLLGLVDDQEQPKVVAEGWTMTEKLIERIVDTTRARGIPYVAMVAPFEVLLSPVGEQLPEDFRERLSANPAYPEQRLAKLFGRLGVPHVMLRDEFQPYLAEVLPFVDGHLNDAGHRYAAGALFRTLSQSRLSTR